MDVHIQFDPNPIKFSCKNPIGFGSDPIHSQEYLSPRRRLGDASKTLLAIVARPPKLMRRQMQSANITVEYEPDDYWLPQAAIGFCNSAAKLSANASVTVHHSICLGVTLYRHVYREGMVPGELLAQV